MNTPIYFVTGNADKFAEAQSMVPELVQIELDLPEVQDLDPHKIIAAKLEAARQAHTDHPEIQQADLIVEDTSLSMSCLNGLPGPLIKWFEQSIGLDGLSNLAIRLSDTRATARTIIGLSRADGSVEFFEGTVEGMIVPPAGEGFGWDAIFRPEGWNKTFGQATKEEKNAISMRKQAFEKLVT